MSSSTKISNKRNDNKLEVDELEEEFLNDDFDDLPEPNEKLKNYQFEVREIMKSGCNLQIAEYSLLQCNIFSHLHDVKSEYNKLFENIKKEMSNKLEVDINKKKDKENNIKDDPNSIQKLEEEEEKENKENQKYEEEIDAIMEEHSEEYKNLQQTKINQIKEDWMKLFKEVLEASKYKDEFLNAKDIYYEKRAPLIESALRLVKKVVNDENEYKKFYENYFGKKYEE